MSGEIQYPTESVINFGKLTIKPSSQRSAHSLSAMATHAPQTLICPMNFKNKFYDDNLFSLYCHVHDIFSRFAERFTAWDTLINLQIYLFDFAVNILFFLLLYPNYRVSCILCMCIYLRQPFAQLCLEH